MERRRSVKHLMSHPEAQGDSCSLTEVECILDEARVIWMIQALICDMIDMPYLGIALRTCLDPRCLMMYLDVYFRSTTLGLALRH